MVNSPSLRRSLRKGKERRAIRKQDINRIGGCLEIAFTEAFSELTSTRLSLKVKKGDISQIPMSVYLPP